MKKPTLRCSEPLARQTWRPKAFELMFPSVLRRTITNATWAEIRTAYASGISLREIARNMGIPEGTVLARAKRESWSREIQNAQVLVKREDAVPAVTATEAIAIAVQQRRERHLERMAGVSERGIDHLETMEGHEIFNSFDINGSYCFVRGVVGMGDRLPTAGENACGVHLGRLLSLASKGEMLCVGTPF